VHHGGQSTLFAVVEFNNDLLTAAEDALPIPALAIADASYPSLIGIGDLAVPRSKAKCLVPSWTSQTKPNSGQRPLK